MQPGSDTPAPADASMPHTVRALLRLAPMPAAAVAAAPAAARDDAPIRVSVAADDRAAGPGPDGAPDPAVRPAARTAARILAAALAASAASACMVGPDFQGATPPPVTGYTRESLRDPALGREDRRGGAIAQSFAQGRDVPGEWWTLFRSKALNGLVAEALARNPTLDAAQASLRAARATTEAQRGALFPQVGFGGQASYNKAAGGDLQSPLNNNALLYSLVTPQVTVSFSPDVFGGTRRALEAQAAQEEGQLWQLEAAYLTLTANVVAAAIQEASLRAQIAATEKVIQAQTDLLNLITKQQNAGQVAGADVVQQTALLAQSQQLLPPLQRALSQQRNLLTALAGRFPSEEVSQTFTLASLHLPRTLPVSLPSRLIEQRPDVKAAEAAVHAASAQVGVAVANRLPQFTISGAVGASATNFAALLNPAASLWTIAGAVAQPLFDGGTLFRRQQAAEETLVAAQAQYRATVIGAYQNVADALRALQADGRAVAAANAAVSASRQSVELVRKQFGLGAVSSASLLITQSAYLQALVTQAQAQANQYADTAALFQALGGGWWNRRDAKPARDPKDPAPFL
ncbi:MULTISPECIES: efflux transporter outer membrane subunit [Methylobacterium]|jgi:NodT family efflux transporter outer membrane factor (OMF) lipoprotein|uniref:efflux transporter outer membrane subunit n=3 Tax=Methylobacteriaceae TaxID=119045 RepID=UPI0008E75893|nr:MULTISPECIES: efflux transporter outer membrane subunit [unclassified Methylobacterium]MBZ6411244.1 efflux transporter outer membrane subunit [Methylobacterium sp.]SFE16460.1 efflux transporter, outer membrane factor (OMF) lipoprotein, NodT family [Methylobacterium sp. yr596]